MKYVSLGLLVALNWGLVFPAFANNANFGKIILSPGFSPDKGKVTGYTGGSYPLSAISNRDRQGKPCIGFADTTPDHIMELKQDFSQLNIQVSSGQDTTILIQGPNNDTIRCGDDTGRNKDASIRDSKFKKGTYRIWVGIFNSGAKHNYTLTVEE
ncbi:hypothetical protein IJ00_01195 [Calothrix sp. 336/3]|nr:hypothetical protein IJ00_01195 [Calothrix sp. 336/3]